MSRNQPSRLWTDAELEQLRDQVLLTAREYREPDKIRELVSKLPSGHDLDADTKWNGTAREIWRDVLTNANSRGIVDDLLIVVGEDPLSVGIHNDLRLFLDRLYRENVESDSRPAATATFDAFRIPASYRRQSAGIQYPPVHEHLRCRLDVRIGLRRGPHVTLVADAADNDLRSALNRVEDRLSRWDVPRWVPRTWWSMVAHSAPPTNTDELDHHLVTESADWRRRDETEDIGIVLSFPDGYPMPSAKKYIDAIRSRVPNAAVVGWIPRTRAGDAADSAADLAEMTGADEFLLRLPVPRSPTNRGMRRPVHDGGAHTALVAALLEDGAYGLPGEDRDALPLPDDAPPRGFARQLVEELNAEDPWKTAEYEVLAAVREFRPDLFPALLAECAAKRIDPQRLSSLRIAARTDEDMDSWITAAGGRLPLPGTDIPSRSIDPATADAVVLGLVRRGDTATAGLWVPYASVTVAHVIEALHSGIDATAFVHDATADQTVAAMRANFASAVDLSRVPNGRVRPGCWAVLARRGITDDIRAFVEQLDDQLRRVLEGTVAPSLLEEESITPLRNGFWPPLVTPD
ncbi:hypothetical protein [Nocardia bovistercoris]|uniref:Uncharacterized protein n=1 Tax=Nocardia bovistercoris TaxID=2785916 RepID=A0A931I7U9_9NOCA|nr:hypothetical protein [Nocardia bovistercoris]MBH0775008.1 hypothetical protein [Nocardia bovistercoris]